MAKKRKRSKRSGAKLDGHDTSPLSEDVRQLRMKDESISAYDVLGAVFSLDGHDGRNRFHAYNNNEITGWRLDRIQAQQFRFKGNTMPTPVLQGYEDLDLLLSHVRDKAKVLEFLRKYDSIVQSVWGPRAMEELPSGLDDALGLLDNVVYGSRGSLSFIALGTNMAQFHAFKQKLQMKTATSFSMHRTVHTESTGSCTYHYRCMKGGLPLSHLSPQERETRTLCRAPKGSVKVGCTAEMVVKELKKEGSIVVTMDLQHTGHIPGTIEDVQTLPVDARIVNKIQELAKQHATSSTILEELKKEAEAAHVAEGLPKVHVTDRRFFPDPKTISNIKQAALKKARHVATDQDPV